MENQEAATTATAQAEQVTPETTNGSLIDFILSDGQSQVVKQQEQQAAATEQAQSNAEEKTFNHKEWLKQEFDVEDAAILKQEREELKAFREKTKQEEFKNEDSKKVYEYLREGKEDEVYEYFSKKKQIEKLSKADVFFALTPPITAPTPPSNTPPTKARVAILDFEVLAIEFLSTTTSTSTIFSIAST